VDGQVSSGQDYRVSAQGAPDRTGSAIGVEDHPPSACPYCGSCSSVLEKARNGDIAPVVAARWRCQFCRNRWWEIQPAGVFS
jgi:hypothetical protein